MPRKGRLGRGRIRSQRPPQFSNIIDFDEASREWRRNKKETGQGKFKYICTGRTQNGNLCKNSVKSGDKYCWRHKKQRKMTKKTH